MIDEEGLKKLVPKTESLIKTEEAAAPSASASGTPAAQGAEK